MPSCSQVDSIPASPVSTILTISSPTIPLKKESQGFHGRVPFGKNSNLEQAREEEGRSDVRRPIFVSSERGESKEGLISRN